MRAPEQLCSTGVIHCSHLSFRSRFSFIYAQSPREKEVKYLARGGKQYKTGTHKVWDVRRKKNLVQGLAAVIRATTKIYCGTKRENGCISPSWRNKRYKSHMEQWVGCILEWLRQCWPRCCSFWDENWTESKPQIASWLLRESFAPPCGFKLCRPTNSPSTIQECNLIF